MDLNFDGENAVATFLCSNAASYIIGTSIEVNEGQSGHI